MGGRHSTQTNSDDDGEVGLGLPVEQVPLPQPALPPRQMVVDRMQAASAAAAPGTSRPPGGAGSGLATHSVAKQRTQRASAAATSAAHRRLVLDVLAASGVGGRAGATGGSYRLPSSNDSTPEDSPLNRTLLTSSSLPLHIFALRDIKCPVCHKVIPADDVECHLVMCLTKPRITYNEDVLTEDKDECVICLEELRQGDTIARLPCLCVYHKGCIDQWFKKNRSCPEHPDG